MPICDEYDINMCVHPDDPPYPVFGLPRIIGRAEDIQWMLDAVPVSYTHLDVYKRQTYNEKGKYWEENEPQIQGAVAAAKDADVIVACIGENSYTETPGNLTDLWPVSYTHLWQCW